jgi:cytochrome c oxidase subunit II
MAKAFPIAASLRKERLAGMAVLIFARARLYAGVQVNTTLVPSIFAPESVPAHSILHLANFVLVITGIIFVIVTALLVYAVVRFRRRANDDGTEPAQIYGSGPVESAWTIVPILIVVVLALTTARVIHEIHDARQPAGALQAQVIGHQ